MQHPLDQTPPDGDFIRYIESLSSPVKPVAPAQAAGVVAKPATTTHTAAQNLAQSTARKVSSGLTPELQSVVAEVFKRRNAQARQEKEAKAVNEDKSEDKSEEPFTPPRDEWEARWQPLFELANQHRWVLVSAGALIALLIEMLRAAFADATDTPATQYYGFFADLLSEPLVIALLLMVGLGLMGWTIWRLKAVTRKASALQVESPWIFWLALLGLAGLEWALSNTSLWGGTLFWLALALGGVSGGAWRLVRGLRRGVLLMINPQSS